MKLPFFKENEQYVPTVTNNDVERILIRDYPETSHNKIKELIEKSNQEPRVIVACFKNSGGNTEAFVKEIEAAAIDFRDVLVDAEYPNYAKETFKTNKLNVKEKNQLIKEDKEQYIKWFN